MEAMIEITGLCKKFGSLVAVKDVNLSVYKNEILGLLGPNGAGKTTAINMICGLIPKTSGKVLIHGRDASSNKWLMGYCAQENIIYPRLTCMEQLQFLASMYDIAPRKSHDRTLNLLSALGLSEKANVKAGALSGGMKRRLSICLAIIHDPEILILDEPEAGLDPQSRIMVRDFIKQFSSGKTVILTTHNMDEADRMADRVAIMDYGQILMTDTPENLKKTIGAGDMIEMTADTKDEIRLKEFIEKISQYGTIMHTHSSQILVKGRNLIELIPKIQKTAEDAGIRLIEIKLRQNTLEDVFIHLTGRNLRS
jgi:ABC-2 type transport system ATP-binding protein